jgi:peptide/nickel transport system ATP-binding protein
MQSGRIIELSSAEEFFANPQHAYSRELLAAIPGRERLAHPPHRALIADR